MSTIYLGIDLHKRSSVWVLIDAARKEIARHTVPCTPDAVTRALSLLPSDGTVSAAIEPVSGWRWYTTLLERAGIDVHVANPLKTRLIADSKLKYDTVDARTLAELLRADFLPESYKAPPDIAELRELMRERLYLVYARTSAKNRIHGIVSRRLPGEALTTPEYASLIDLVKELTLLIKPVDAKVKTIASRHPVASLLMTMPTVGPVTSLTIVAEVGDFGRFSTPRHLASYAGLAPSERSSGTSTRRGHITKIGSRFLRAAIVEAAFRVRPHHDPQLVSFLERLIPVCGKKRARVALGRKMLTIMWHMVKRNTPYHSASPLGSVKRADLARNVLVP